jgi:hypothetical protein
MSIKYTFLIVGLFSFSKIFSQKVVIPIDKIFLKDSITVYEGLIVEQAPARYVKIIRQIEKDTVQVLMKDIWKMLRIYPITDTAKENEKSKKTTKRPLRNKYVYIELAGSCGIYSLNYDFRFNKTIVNKWGLRIGLEYLPLNTFNFSGDKLKFNTFLFPFMVNYLAGKKNRFLGFGLGAVYLLKWKTGKYLAPEYEYFIPNLDRRIPNVYGTFSIGYRHQPLAGKIMWGVNATPLIGNSFVIPNIGFKIGYQIN